MIESSDHASSTYFNAKAAALSRAAAFVSDCKGYFATTTRKSERLPLSNSIWKR